MDFIGQRLCSNRGRIDHGFGKSYGVELADGAFVGLFARAVIVLYPTGKVKHTELVPQIGEEPNYEAALKTL